MRHTRSNVCARSLVTLGALVTITALLTSTFFQQLITTYPQLGPSADQASVPRAQSCSQFGPGDITSSKLSSAKVEKVCSTLPSEGHLTQHAGICLQRPLQWSSESQIIGSCAFVPKWELHLPRHILVLGSLLVMHQHHRVDHVSATWGNPERNLAQWLGS